MLRIPASASACMCRDAVLAQLRQEAHFGGFLFALRRSAYGLLLRIQAS